MKLKPTLSVDHADVLTGPNFASAVQHNNFQGPDHNKKCINGVTVQRKNLSNLFVAVQRDDGPYAPGFNPPMKE